MKKGSAILDFLFGYERSEKNFEDSHIKNTEKVFADRFISGVGSTFAKRTLNNPISRFFNRLMSVFAHSSLRFFGSMFLSFGLLTLLLNLANYYFSNMMGTDFTPLIIGTLFSVIAIPMILIDMPASAALERLTLIDALLFEVLCLKRARAKDSSSRSLPTALGVFLGCIPAIIGFFTSPVTVLLCIACAVFFVLAMFSPEFSFMLTLLILPALPLMPHSSIILAALVGVTLASFILKVLIGKRIYHFEQYDAIILFFSLFILISGIFNKGLDSFENSLLFITLSFGYFLASNLIVNRRLADNSINMILFSSVPTGIFGIVYYFLAPRHPEWTDPVFHESISARASSTFGNPNIYAVFLIVVMLFSLTYALDKRRGASRIFYVSVFLLNTFCMVITWTRGAWLALILAFVAYFILHFKRMPKLLVIPILVIPIGLSFIPSTFTERLLSAFNLADSSISVRLSVWRSSLLMLGNNIFVGVGMGESSFKEEFLKYAEDGVTAPHSHNLLLEIGCQAGVFALILFCFLMLVRLRHVATYKRYLRSSSLTSPITMTAVIIFALLAFGMTDYIWYSSSMFFLFWIVFGMGSALLRITKKERDERHDYRAAAASADSASVNIRIGD